MTDGKWLIELNHLETTYNDKRWKFRNKFKRYIRCNPYTDNYSEEELIQDLKEIAEIRKQMKELSKNNDFKKENKAQYHMNKDDFFFTASRPIW